MCTYKDDVILYSSLFLRIYHHCSTDINASIHVGRWHDACLALWSQEAHIYARMCLPLTVGSIYMHTIQTSVTSRYLAIHLCHWFPLTNNISRLTECCQSPAQLHFYELSERQCLFVQSATTFMSDCKVVNCLIHEKIISIKRCKTVLRKRTISQVIDIDQEPEFITVRVCNSHMVSYTSHLDDIGNRSEYA